jgi:crotonobetainyl-CoA:carnitine CoA-transferase CaiB-like acyl-CoA transferase
MPYNCVYETKDRKYIAIGCWEPRLFENLCQALGREDFVPCQNDTGEKRKEMFRVFKRIFRQKTREEWFELLKEKNVGVSPVKTLEEVFQDPQVLHRKMLIELSHPIFGKIKQVGIPIKMSETKAEIKNLAPTPGQHTKQILLDLGYASQQIEEMGEKGVIV